MQDGKILAAITSSRDAYDRVKAHLDPEELSLQGQTWYPLIQSWYENDPAASKVDMDLLKERGTLALPEAHLDTLLGWINDLPEVDSPQNVVTHLIELKRYHKGNELSQAIQGRQDEKVSDLLSEYAELREATTLGRSTITWTNDDGAMDALLDREGLIKIAPKRLNEKLLGGATPGDTILLFGRPEAGKTLFTVNIVAGLLKFGHKVFYVGNEEGTYKTRKRIINNLSNCDNDTYAANPEATKELARQRGLDNLHMAHMEPGSVAEIEAVCKELKPDVVVVDQIRNLEISGKGNDKLTDRLGALGTSFRGAAARHNFLGIAVTQAGDKTERHGQEVPPWLTMSDIADNRTSLAAQFDVIVGIGCTEEMRRTGMRALSLCKNKLSDREDAHEGITVQVDVRRSKVR
jgi:hypothetical protein